MSLCISRENNELKAEINDLKIEINKKCTFISECEKELNNYLYRNNNDTRNLEELYKVLRTALFDNGNCIYYYRRSL